MRTLPDDDEPGEVVGTYRVLTPGAARRAGSFYSDTEFDLTRLRPLRERMVELGRSCVHADHRSGAVILALWGALAQFMEHNAMETVIGCASISMRDGGHCAASLWAIFARRTWRRSNGRCARAWRCRSTTWTSRWTWSRPR